MSSLKKSTRTDKKVSRYFFAAIGSGLGDLILCLPVLDALIASGKPVYLVRRSFRQEGIAARIEGLAGELDESELRVEDSDRYINLRQHPLQTDHVWGSPEFESFFGPSDMERIVASISADFGFPISFSSLKRLKYKSRPELENCIAFVPGTDGFYKHWPHQRWLALKRTLESAGEKLLLFGKPDESPAVRRLLEAGMNWIETATVSDAIDAVSSIKELVSVDTGLLHIAVQQEIPSVALIHPLNFHHRSAKHCRNLLARNCASSCQRDLTPKEGFNDADSLAVDLKFDRRECQMPLDENCMASITVDCVLKALRS